MCAQVVLLDFFPSSTTLSNRSINVSVWQILLIGALISRHTIAMDHPEGDFKLRKCTETPQQHTQQLQCFCSAGFSTNFVSYILMSVSIIKNLVDPPSHL